MKRIGLIATILIASLTVSFAQEGRSEVVLRIDGEYFYVDTLLTGRGLEELASLYALSSDEIVAANVGVPIAVGQPLRIPLRKRIGSLAPRRGDEGFLRHRVHDGETYFSVAVANALSLEWLIKDNPGIDLTDISNLRYLNIRKAEKGKTNSLDIAASSARYAAILNLLSSEYSYAQVEKGQTLYSISRAHHITPNELSALNGNPEVLSTGMIVKFPRQASAVSQDNTAAWSGVLPKEQTADQELHGFEGGALNVALLLPLTDGKGSVRGSFVEFFNGALLAAEGLKAEGHSVNLNLYDTQNSSSSVDSLVCTGALDGVDLIIGPVYERNMQPAAEHAALRGITMVSPLAAVDNQSGDNFFQMAPIQSGKNLKMNDLVQPETNVIFVYTATTDLELEREAEALVGGHPVATVAFSDDFQIDSLLGRPIEDVMMREDNLFVVLSDSEIEVDRTLAIISSIMNSRQPRYPSRRVPIRILGSSKWTRYRNLDKNLLFKLDVTYVANYHADRGNARVRDFDRRYIAAFGRMPSLYAYRAYDAMQLFGKAMFTPEGTLLERLNGAEAPLQTHYTFESIDGAVRNTEWVVVNYGHNYKITTR